MNSRGKDTTVYEEIIDTTPNVCYENPVEVDKHSEDKSGPPHTNYNKCVFILSAVVAVLFAGLGGNMLNLCLANLEVEV